jgi:hypothetical protein
MLEKIVDIILQEIQKHMHQIQVGHQIYVPTTLVFLNAPSIRNGVSQGVVVSCAIIITGQTEGEAGV